MCLSEMVGDWKPVLWFGFFFVQLLWCKLLGCGGWCSRFLCGLLLCDVCVWDACRSSSNVVAVIKDSYALLLD